MKLLRILQIRLIVLCILNNVFIEYDADLGGTELYDPLVAAYSLIAKKGYKKTIFLLTDGAIWDIDPVLEVINIL